MNAKKLSFLLLILVAVACTNRSTSSEQDEMRHWNNVLQQINALLLENKARQTLDLAKQTLPEILESAEKNGTTDTLIYYARKIFNACGNNYINTKQYKDGIDYMDSIGNHPLIREHCPHELLSFKAGLNQLYGNNPEAVRLAEDYLQLPVCTSANDFIRQAEIISGVVKETQPDVLIAVDALAARSTRRLNRTIQITNTGIQPGSGVGNHRNALTEETLGVPVIAIGIPTVVDAATIVGDALEKLMSGEKEFDAVKYMGQHRMAFAELNNMYMTGKDIDSVIKRVSYTVSEGINIAMEKNWA